MPFRRWSSKHKKTFGITREEEEKKHGKNYRVPPKPDSYYTNIKGCCRWCGDMIIREDETINYRRSWHPKCLEEYLFIYHQPETRKHIWIRDGGKCAYCDKAATKGKWQLDHIKPLVEQKDVPWHKRDFSYWMPDNLQILCNGCHKKKTSKEATERARKRRGEKVEVNKRVRDKYIC